MQVPKLANLCVKDEFRGKGIGKLLVNAALDVFKNNNYEYVILQVDSDNIGARSFYKRIGFKEKSLDSTSIRYIIKETNNLMFKSLTLQSERHQKILMIKWL